MSDQNFSFSYTMSAPSGIEKGTNKESDSSRPCKKSVCVYF